MPTLEASEVRKVRPFFVRRLLAESESAVKKLIRVRLSSNFSVSSASLYGWLSETMLPSENSIILSEYSRASSGLCVTIITSLSPAACFISSIT